MHKSLFFVFLHMPRITTLLLLFFWIFEISAQDEVRLPADLRQHNLTTYNSSLFNPVFALDRNDPESVAFWTRWQWQGIDADPTTLYLNYTRPFKENSVLGAAFFQHNTGIFFNTGGVVNYAHQIQFSESVRLSLGFNLFGFVQKLADTRFPTDPTLPVPGETNDFILQWAPGASISVERMTLSMGSENLLDYNFRVKEANTPAADKIFMGMMSYDFPISLGAQKALLRPSLYLRTIPQQENQIGILSLLRTAKYWAQLGYNNFYGVGIGAGGTFLRKFNLGAVFEFGTSASINSKDPSFEIIASYFLGNPDERSVVAVYEDEMLEETLVDSELEEEKIKEELEKAEKLANEEDPKEEDPDKPEVEEEESPTEEAEEPKEEEPVTEEITKKEQRQAEKEAAAEEKRLKKEQDRIAKEEKDRLEEEAKEKARLAKEEQAQIEREMKEANAKKEEQAKQAELAEKQKEELQKAEAKAAEEQRKAAEKAEAEKSAVQKRQDSIAQAQKAVQEAVQQAATKKRLDSLAEARKAQAEVEAQAMEAQRKLDSIAQAKAAVAEAEQEEVKPEAGEKYEEVQTEDGLEPGFYLIANVFGTKKYFDAFMADLDNRGLAPKSFLRSLNNYNYVYLERYDTMAEARRARDSEFNGRYNDKTWVFRVVGN